MHNPAVALFALLGIHGALRIRSITADSQTLSTVRIGLVNHAVPPLERWDPKNSAPILRSLRELTHKLENDGVELGCVDFAFARFENLNVNGRA